MQASEIRKIYIEFFKSKGHKEIASASLLPENDPTVLFTTAGMHPLVPYLLGEKHPSGTRLTDVQKCVRTGDIDEVGDQWHLSFFEMLGNWSLGDYFKKEAIEWSFEFLTDEKWMGIDPNKLYVSVFKGDEDASRDDEVIEIWKEQFAKAKIIAGIWENGEIKEDDRIFLFPKSENWWGPAGKTGPCGPCTEMFYDTGKVKCCPECNPSCSCGKFVEIWNDVFMQYNKTADGKYESLKQKNVDTGMGLERMTAVMQGKDNNYETELFAPIIREIEKLSGKKYNVSAEITKSMRVIADHLRAATFILGDEKGIVPSNLGQGYVLRRFIRRAVRYGKQIGINEKWTSKIAEIIINNYSAVYPELEKNKEFIISELDKEEEKFSKTLEKGLKMFNKLVPKDAVISGEDVFCLFATYGFPVELTDEMAKDNNWKIDKEEFNKQFKKHQELSRTASAGMFKGGLADNGEQTTKFHTATHLLHQALRQVLGEHVQQKGSNLNAERLRFDFSHTEKMTPEQVAEVEKIVNDQIQKELPVHCEEMSVEEAKNAGALGFFESKYGEKVKVYSIGSSVADAGEYFSREICGGPHIKNTSELGEFKIQKEESSSSGIRRIKGVLEK
ncbi:alanine--tRNA ligase [Patescibacteria group bacterium]